MSEINTPPVDLAHLETDSGVDIPESTGFSIDYRRLIETAKRYFWVFILYAIAGLSVATVYLINATPIYQSSTRLKVEQRVMAPNPTNGMDPSEDLRGIEMLQTIQLGFVSRSLMERMVERKNLKTRTDFTKNTGLEGEVDTEAYVQFLLGNTHCQLIQGTRLMTVSFDHPDPHVAQEMVDTLVQEYILLGREQRLGAASVNLSYLIEERKAREENLRRSEEKLAQYTRELGSISVEGNDGSGVGGMNIIAAQLVQLNDRLGVAKGERAKLQSDSEQISKYRNDPKALLEIASISDLSIITTLRGQLNGLDADITRTRLKYRPGNPQLIQLESQRDSLQKAMEAEALRAPQTVDRTLQAAIKTEAALQQETDMLEKKVIKNKEMAIQSKVLERQINADTETYQAVLKKYNEETSQATSQPVFIEIVDTASPAFKIKPNVVQTLAVSIFVSLLLAAGTVLLLSSLDTSFKSVDDVESTLGIQVFAAIPQFEITKDKHAKDTSTQHGPSVSLPLLEDPYSAASESYRTLRASLLLVEDENHRILITSATPEEGKSTTSINLAISMAQRGARTLLIEADLRKPVLQKRLIGATEHLGVADFLNDRADFEEIIQATSIPNLSILCAGRVNKNSGELLLRRARVEKLLDLSRKGFDQVIVDSAPLLAVSDTLTIARHFRVISLVVRSHKTPRRLVTRAIALLKRIKRVPVGVALSMVPPGNDYYYYGYSEGGDRAYGAEHQPRGAEKA